MFNFRFYVIRRAKNGYELRVRIVNTRERFVENIISSALSKFLGFLGRIGGGSACAEIS